MSKPSKHPAAPVDRKKRRKGTKKARVTPHAALSTPSFMPLNDPAEVLSVTPSGSLLRDASGTVAQFVAYDENLLERVRTQWQFGDWQSLTKIDRDTLQHHPDRAKLALLVASGHLQTAAASDAKQFVRLAHDWGCSKKLIARILAAGVHNTLGRAAAVVGQKQRAVQHFESAIAIGTPGAESRLLVQARVDGQLAQLGLPDHSLQKVDREEMKVTSSSSRPPIAKSILGVTDTLEQQKRDFDAQLKRQADELIRVRTYLDASLNKEVANAAKQIEAAIGLQNYFATGALPNFNTERHSWPISSDFALYLIELLETNDYDLIIEFGSGISTVITAKALTKIAVRRQGKRPVEFVSFDHLEKYYGRTLAQLKQAGLAAAVQLHLTPLTDYAAPNGNTYAYYGCQKTLADLAQRHPATGLRLLVVVDGPPAGTGRHARYPAGPLILAYFRGAQVDFLLDDYIRDEEKEIAKLWRDEFSASNLRYTSSEKNLEKDACLISIAGDLPTPTND